MKTVKPLILVLAILFASVTATAQDFSKYETMKDVTSMVMTSKMFKLLNKIDVNSSDPEMQNYVDLIENLNEIRVFVTDRSDVRTTMNADAKSYISSGGLEQLMRINEDGKAVNFYIKPGKNDDFVNELFMHLDGTEDGKPSTVILQITGNINLKQVSKLASDLKVPGSEELKNNKKQK